MPPTDDARTARDAAIARVVAASDADARRIYDEVYVPAALAFMRAEAAADPDLADGPLDVLVATCGTQPYSVALSLTRSPAVSVVLLVTDDSEAHARRAVEMAGVDPAAVRYREVRSSDSADVYEIDRKVLEDLPVDRRSRARVDITSGTKAMVAGSSNAAGYFDVPQVYVASEPIREMPRLFGREVFHRVPHPLTVFGDPVRLEGERAFDEGRFDLAAHLFADLAAAGVPGYDFEARALLARAYERWEALAFQDARAHLERAIDVLTRRNPRFVAREPLRDTLPRLGRQAAALCVLAAATAGRTTRPTTDADQTNALLRHLLAAARRHAGRSNDLAALLLYRATELAMQRRLATRGHDAAAFRADDPATLLATYNAAVAPQHHLTSVPGRVALQVGLTLLTIFRDAAVDGLDITGDRFRGQLEARNGGLFAHGFSALPADRLDTLRATVLPFLQAVSALDDRPLPDPDPDLDFVRLR